MLTKPEIEEILDRNYRRGVQDGRKQAADEVFAAISEMEAAGPGWGVLGAFSDLRRRLAHLYVTQVEGSR